MSPLRIAITGATGLVGRALAPHLRVRGDTVTALRRGDGDGAWSVGTGEIRIPGGMDALVHLAGRNVATRWTSKAKKEIWDSRVPATEKLANSTAGSDGMVDKAQNVMLERRKADQAKLDALVNGQDPGGDKPAANPAPAPVVTEKPPAPKPAPPPYQAAGSATLSDGVSATTTEVQAAADASIAFRTWVANAVIRGVVASRAIINGRLVTVGQSVDVTLGIVFDSVDNDAHILIFRDKTGAKVTKKY